MSSASEGRPEGTAMSLEPVDDPLLREIQAELDGRPRQHGHYILRLVRMRPGWAGDEEASLDRLFQGLDTKDWPPPEERGGLAGRWTDCEVPEDVARDEVVAALVGGRQIGHLAQTVSPKQADSLWRRFRALFSGNVRCFIGLGLGGPEYAFQRGAVLVDADRAGALCVVEGD